MILLFVKSGMTPYSPVLYHRAKKYRFLRADKDGGRLALKLLADKSSRAKRVMFAKISGMFAGI